MTRTLTRVLAIALCTLTTMVATPGPGMGGTQAPVTVGTITFDNSYVDASPVDDRRPIEGRWTP
jgi:hypothetical protein